MDCLITKLKGIVDDNSLLKLGEFRIELSDFSNQAYFDLQSDVEQTISSENGLINNESNTLRINASSPTFFIENGKNVKLSIPNKYALTTFNIPNIKNIKSSDGENELGIFKIIEKKLVKLSVQYSSVEGDISYLANFTNLVNLNIGASLLKGDIASISNLKITSLWCHDLSNLSGDFGAIRCPLEHFVTFGNGITGTFEEFVKTQRLAGRTNGSITDDTNNNFNEDAITFNGTNPEASTVSWTPTQITCGETTITA